MLKILHFVHDEKFIDDMMDAFDYIGQACVHQYILVTNDQSYEFRFIKQKERMLLLKENQLLKHIHNSGCHAVLLHSLSVIPSKYIPAINKNIKIYWSAWGHDLYNTPIEEHAFILKKKYWHYTKKAIGGNLKYNLQHKHALLWYYFHKSLYKNVLKRIDYFSGIIPIEYELMKRNKSFHAKRLDFRYFNMIDFYTKEGLDTPITIGDNILIGNSGNFTNNHIDVFHILKHMDLKSRKVVVPLSYCGYPWYIDQVKKSGNSIFNDNFLPLDVFLPYQQYNQIVMSCGYAIFLIETQQAMGNIHMSLWNGLKVFLSESSILYQHFKSLGMYVFSVQKDLYEDGLTRKLTMEEVMHNRKIIIEYLYLEKSLSIYQNVINTLKNDSIF